MQWLARPSVHISSLAKSSCVVRVVSTGTESAAECHQAKAYETLQGFCSACLKLKDIETACCCKVRKISKAEKLQAPKALGLRQHHAASLDVRRPEAKLGPTRSYLSLEELGDFVPSWSCAQRFPNRSLVRWCGLVH